VDANSSAKNYDVFGELGQLFKLKLYMVIMQNLPPGIANADWANFDRSTCHSTALKICIPYSGHLEAAVIGFCNIAF